jgi:peptide methionine sulfoxide reductase msrA/msrB
MFNYLSDNEKKVILDKETEQPFKGEYDNFYLPGIYLCRQCDKPLFDSKAKFKSGCGWPSFDQHFEGAVKQISDVDGKRIEILCAGCGGHLGHVFEEEGFTDKNTRHCVNSLSVRFIPENSDNNKKIIYLGAGCFWCTEAVFQRIKGVIEVTPGYGGGFTENPTYEKVCAGQTGHIELAKIVYDNTICSLETILEIFFKIHDPTSMDKQGNDKGPQYRSAIFYTNNNQRKVIFEFIEGMKIVTVIKPYINFYPAEDYHKNYYNNNRDTGYCQHVIDPKLKKLF